MLPCLPLSLPHPAADTRPRCRPAPPVNHAAPRRPRPAALPCLPARLRHERTLPPLTTLLRAILTMRSVLPCRPPPPFPSLLSPRTRRFGDDSSASLRSVLRPRPSSSSPPSPPPTRPPRRLPPPETPPPLWFSPEHRHRPPLSVSTTTRSLSIQMGSPLTFSLLPRHCRATPSPSSITRAASPPLNATA
jgi:hypothetical protein